MLNRPGFPWALRRRIARGDKHAEPERPRSHPAHRGAPALRGPSATSTPGTCGQRSCSASRWRWDEIALHVRDLDDGLREAVLAGALPAPARCRVDMKGVPPGGADSPAGRVGEAAASSAVRPGR
jgi:hypothetical protein